MTSNDKINAIIWILKKHPEKSRDWAEEQLQRAVDNTDLQEPITAKQYAEILKLEFGVQPKRPITVTGRKTQKV